MEKETRRERKRGAVDQIKGNLSQILAPAIRPGLSLPKPNLKREDALKKLKLGKRGTTPEGESA